MAETALLTLDAMHAATSRSWVKDGHKLFNQITERLLVLAGFRERKEPTRTDDVAANRRALQARLGQMGATQRN